MVPDAEEGPGEDESSRDVTLARTERVADRSHREESTREDDEDLDDQRGVMSVSSVGEGGESRDEDLCGFGKGQFCTRIDPKLCTAYSNDTPGVPQRERQMDGDSGGQTGRGVVRSQRVIDRRNRGGGEDRENEGDCRGERKLRQLSVPSPAIPQAWRPSTPEDPPGAELGSASGFLPARSKALSRLTDVVVRRKDVNKDSVEDPNDGETVTNALDLVQRIVEELVDHKEQETNVDQSPGLESPSGGGEVGFLASQAGGGHRSAVRTRAERVVRSVPLRPAIAVSEKEGAKTH